MFSVFKKSPKYVYVLVRTDIPLANQMVQVGHACFDSGTKFGKLECYMVLLQVANEEELLSHSKLLKYHKVKHTVFYEDDFPIGHTALCTQPITKKHRPLFANHALWSVSE